MEHSVIVSECGNCSALPREEVVLGNRTADGLGNFGKNREYVFGCVRVRVHVRVCMCSHVCVYVRRTSSCIYGQLFHWFIDFLLLEGKARFFLICSSFYHSISSVFSRIFHRARKLVKQNIQSSHVNHFFSKTGIWAPSGSFRGSFIIPLHSLIN